MNGCFALRPKEAMHPVPSSRKLFGKLVEFGRLPSGERAFLAAAWALAPVVNAALSRFGFERLLRELPRAHPRHGTARAVDVERGDALVRIAFRRHGTESGGCLPESLTQYLLHCVLGPTPKIVVGVRRAADAASPETSSLGWWVGAHAWIERDEGPPREPTFAPIVACSARSGIWKAQGQGT